MEKAGVAFSVPLNTFTERAYLRSASFEMELFPEGKHRSISRLVAIPYSRRFKISFSIFLERL